MITRETEEQISAYADGQLKGDESDFIVRLLETDPDAQTFYRDILDLRNDFAAMPTWTLGSDFTKAVMDRIEADDFSRRPLALSRRRIRPLLERLARPRIWVYPFSALVVVLLILPLFSNYSRQRSDKPTVARLTFSEPSADAAADSANGSAMVPAAEPAKPTVAPLEPIHLTDEERAGRRTAPKPLAEGAVIAENKSVETVSVVLKSANAGRFPFFLQKIAADAGIEQVEERRAGNATLFEMTVTGEQAAALSEKLSALELLAEPPVFSDSFTEQTVPFALQLFVAVEE